MRMLAHARTPTPPHRLQQSPYKLPKKTRIALPQRTGGATAISPSATPGEKYLETGVGKADLKRLTEETARDGLTLGMLCGTPFHSILLCATVHIDLLPLSVPPPPSTSSPGLPPLSTEKIQKHLRVCLHKDDRRKMISHALTLKYDLSKNAGVFHVHCWRPRFLAVPSGPSCCAANSSTVAVTPRKLEGGVVIVHRRCVSRTYTHADSSVPTPRHCSLTAVYYMSMHGGHHAGTSRCMAEFREEASKSVHLAAMLNDPSVCPAAHHH